MKTNASNNGEPQTITQITTAYTEVKYQPQEAKFSVLEPPYPKYKRPQNGTLFTRIWERNNVFTQPDPKHMKQDASEHQIIT